MRDEKVPAYNFPIPRYAHSFVYDPVHDCFYMFGGNSGSTSQTSTNMRLDDFWKMQVYNARSVLCWSAMSNYCYITADETKEGRHSEGVSIVTEETKVYDKVLWSNALSFN